MDEIKNIYNKLLENRIVFINGDIDSRVASDVVAKLLYLDSISNEDITLFINSKGGEVSCGMMIYDTIKYLESDVSTICVGEASSMAAILLMGGTKGKRKALEHGEIMIHDLYAGTEGKYLDVINSVEHIKKSHNLIVELLEQNTKMDKKSINSKIYYDCWLSADEALNLGIIDSVIKNK